MHRFLFCLMFITSAVYADPEDLPPTAFQLAQLRFYVDNVENVDSSTSKGVFTRNECSFESIQEINNLVTRCIREFIPKIENWEQYVRDLVEGIKQRAEDRKLSDCFIHENVTPIILQAIEFEEKAAARGCSILWRFSQQSPEKDKTSPGNLSFSLGLFSGLLYDGYKTYNYGDARGSASTYFYWSTRVAIDQIVLDGQEGFYLRLRETLPDFFEAFPEYPASYDPTLSVFDIFDNANDWYFEKGQYPRELLLELNNLKKILERYRNGREPNKDSSLYGVEIPNHELEKLRQASIESEESPPYPGSNSDKRGDFLAPDYALFGRGEFFHPKCVFPENGIVRRISIGKIN